MIKRYSFLNNSDKEIMKKITHKKMWNIINMYFSSDSNDNYNKEIIIDDMKIWPASYYNPNIHCGIYSSGTGTAMMNIPLSMYGKINKKELMEEYKKRTRIIEKVCLRSRFNKNEILFTNKKEIRIKINPNTFIEIEIDFNETMSWYYK